MASIWTHSTATWYRSVFNSTSEEYSEVVLRYPFLWPSPPHGPQFSPITGCHPHDPLYATPTVRTQGRKNQGKQVKKKKKKGEKKIFHDKATIWHMPSPWKICVDRYRVWALCEEHHVQTTQRSPFPRGGPSEEMVHPTSHMLCKVRYTPQ